MQGKIMTAVFLIFATFVFVPALSQANPTVVGYDGSGNQLIYDPVRNITWYDYTYKGTDGVSGATWDQAKSWVAGLKVGGVSGWRLPTTEQLSGLDSAYTNVGEMGQLRIDLGIINGHMANTEGEPFKNLVTGALYWTGTPNTNSGSIPQAWLYTMYYGEQASGRVDGKEYVLAIYDGKVTAPVPIPGAILLFAPGLAGIAAIRRRFKK